MRRVSFSEALARGLLIYWRTVSQTPSGISNPDVLISGLEFVTGFIKYFNGIFWLPILKTPKCLFQAIHNFAIEFKLKPIPLKSPANVVTRFYFLHL